MFIKLNSNDTSINGYYKCLIFFKGSLLDSEKLCKLIKPYVVHLICEGKNSSHQTLLFDKSSKLGHIKYGKEPKRKGKTQIHL